MRIIKHGQPKLFQAKCKECGTEFELTRTEFESVDDPGYGIAVTRYVKCPVCTEEVTVWDI